MKHRRFHGSSLVTVGLLIVVGLIAYSWSGSPRKRALDSLPAPKKDRARGARSPGKERTSWSLTETAVGGEARPEGNGKTSTAVSYFIGNDPSRWKSGLPAFETVSLGDVWPNISLDLRARGKSSYRGGLHCGIGPEVCLPVFIPGRTERVLDSRHFSSVVPSPQATASLEFSVKVASAPGALERRNA